MRRPIVVICAILVVTVIGLYIEDRAWWCPCGKPWLWIGNVWSEHCSGHVADPYSLTHVSHGLIFFALLVWLRPRMHLGWRLAIAIALASAWEVVENSAFIIDRYRTNTMSMEYLGDSIANALGDVLSCAIGFLIAHRFGLLIGLALLVAMEVTLALLIRDNLTLGTLMLIHPFEFIKSWQMAGQPPA